MPLYTTVFVYPDLAVNLVSTGHLPYLRVFYPSPLSSGESVETYPFLLLWSAACKGPGGSPSVGPGLLYVLGQQSYNRVLYVSASLDPWAPYA